MGSPVVVKLDNPGDIVAAIPYSLGYHPTESLVAIALAPVRGRIRFTMRLDLLEPAYDDEVAQMCAARMAHAKAASVLLVIYTSPPDDAGRLPRQQLVEAVDAALPVPLRDALLVATDRCWSYVCRDARCCPPAGRPVSTDTPGAVAVAAAHALHGSVVLPDRDALVATTRAVGGVTAASMQQATLRAVESLADGDRTGDVDATRALVDEWCVRYAAGGVALPHDVAAVLQLRLHNVLARDALIGRLARGDDTLGRLVRDLARLAQPPWDAPAATVLGVEGYFRGDGVVAVAAAERALESDPDYSLAHLLLDAVHGQMDPRHMRRVWRQALP